MWKNGSTATNASSASIGDRAERLLDVRDEIAVREHDALRQAGRPRGVRQHDDVVQIDRHLFRERRAAASEAIDVYPSASPMTYTSLTAESAIAAVAVSRNVGIVTRRVAPESTSWWWTSPDVYVGLTVVSTPPASATAWKMTPYSGQLGAITATTSPFASPLSNQPPA